MQLKRKGQHKGEEGWSRSMEEKKEKDRKQCKTNKIETAMKLSTGENKKKNCVWEENH